jgi:hypothetical protein
VQARSAAMLLLELLNAAGDFGAHLFRYRFTVE